MVTSSPARFPSADGSGETDAPGRPVMRGLTSNEPWQYGGPGLEIVPGIEHRAVVRQDYVTVVSGMTLSYLVFPTFNADAIEPERRFASTHFAVDLLFDDGGRLSSTALCDQHGFVVTAEGQGASKSLVADQWNYKSVDLSSLAGKRVLQVEAVLAAPDGASGWLDSVVLGRPNLVAPDASPAERVNTVRGTYSSRSYSRGNTLPATAVPHGFNFVTPSTDARSSSWVYKYCPDDAEPGLSALQLLSISHQASVWMGDRGVLQIMPSGHSTRPDPCPTARALRFRHANEHAFPHRYSVAFEGGITADVAPTSHAAIFEFGFPGQTGTVMLDQLTNNGSLVLENGPGKPFEFTGHTDGEGGAEQRMYFTGHANRPAIEVGFLPNDGHPNVAGFARFDATVNGDEIFIPARGVSVRIALATSFISLDQARRNLKLEITGDDSIEAVAHRAKGLWNAKLSAVEVTGGTDDQLG